MGPPARLAALLSVALAAAITIACGTTSRPPESANAAASSSRRAIGSSIARPRPVSPSPTSTACRASSISPRCCRAASRFSTTTMTAISTSTSRKGACCLSSKPIESATVPPAAHALPLKGRLFRNDLSTVDGAPSLRFTDVTAASGIESPGYGMGAAAGDVDNDGCVDLYLTNLGPNQLFRNNCDGTFTDRSRASGTDDPAWSVSASFLDYDRDGWLDLYVGNYVQWDVASDKPCTGLTGRRDYCTPKVYVPAPDRLYRNRGNGTFEDVTAKSLLGGPFGPALGVASADFDGDGWIDVYVANDGTENLLWMNQRNGTFRNTGLLSGVSAERGWEARSEHGRRRRRLRQRRRRRHLHDPSPGRGQQSLREPRRRPCSRTSARHRGSDRSASGTAASAPPGSTTTTTAGWICSPSTARSRPSRGGRPTRGSRTTNASSCSATCATAASRTSPRRPARSSPRLR